MFCCFCLYIYIVYKEFGLMCKLYLCLYYVLVLIIILICCVWEFFKKVFCLFYIKIVKINKKIIKIIKDYVKRYL